ncbi:MULTISPECIES: VF530 family DNA-binding protein [Corallincola]|uniref:DUF2132 domain-containing protein n=3 Tax=Corallincola TaxID=1775176 RepID=A0A368NMU5_9GAMM|nr:MULTISPECIES: VF530 family protein [Corallincola]RCU51902.1 DUF2132 domain-containing protein [Corallincola holothuriorum]TAA47393.1 DUF2132 domain-containing protein [Corallincola spongiicola]TCI05066.1 DUF2132 domain-containing protein [Corallincola luteus]
MTEQNDSAASQKDPLHGVTLKALLSWLIEHYGWEELGQKIPINCFLKDPSLNSSLKFLRKTPWARTKVEALYIKAQQQAKSIWGSNT